MKKQIPGFPGYYADERGNIYSYGMRDNPRTFRLLHPRRTKRDGRRILNLVRDKKIVTVKVAQLVLFAFVSPRPRGKIACHGAEGCASDELTNVYWGSHSRNLGADKLRDGTMQYGERQHCAKLNAMKVRIIRRAFAEHRDAGITQQYLADVFHINQTGISSVILRKTWKHIM